MELTASFVELLDGFRPVFTSPSFETFRLLMTGWVLSFRHRYVTDLIVSSDSVGYGHFSDYHRFFSLAAWNIDDLWNCLAILIVKTLIGEDATITLAGDDTLCRKRGLGIFGSGMHHDALAEQYEIRQGHTVPHLSPRDRLAGLIEARQLTQAELSRGSRVPRTTINEILSGRRSISKANAVRLANYFGVSAEEFIAEWLVCLPTRPAASCTRPRCPRCGWHRRG